MTHDVTMKCRLAQGEKVKHKLENRSLVAIPQQTDILIHSFHEMALFTAYLNRGFLSNHGDMASLRHGRAVLAVLTECVLRPFVLIVSWGKKKDSGKRNVALVEP